MYGSPTLDQVEAFAKGFYSALEAEVGEEEAGRISVEVSSPVSRSLSLHLES